MKHVAIIPARAGSSGIPGKNVLLFNQTAEFIDKSDLFETTYVSSNDDDILLIAADRGYQLRRRPEEISGPTAPIKPTFEDLVEHFAIPGDTCLWLFFLAFPWHDLEHFTRARAMWEQRNAGSMIAFLPAKTHPYFCWGVDTETDKIFRFVETNTASRQQFPPAYSNHHYISCTRADFLPQVNSNLIGPGTVPFFMTSTEGDQLVDMNEPEDFLHWHKAHPLHYAKWWHATPASRRPTGIPTP